MNEELLMQAIGQLAKQVESNTAALNAHLTSMEENQRSQQKALSKLAINQENHIMPYLKLLYESQTTIIRQLQDCVTIEDLEEVKSTVHILSDATKKLNQEMMTVQTDIATLKQAL